MSDTSFRVFDSETNGLAYNCDKIWVLSWTDNGVDYNSTNDYQTMRDVLSEDCLLVGHNAIMFDMVVFNRIMGLSLDYTRFVDTLALSWYLFPERQRHGLEYWGEDLGVKKPEVEDWENLSYEEYKHRCESDVKINWLLWEKCRKRLEEIYE